MSVLISQIEAYKHLFEIVAIFFLLAFKSLRSLGSIYVDWLLFFFSHNTNNNSNNENDVE